MNLLSVFVPWFVFCLILVSETEASWVGKKNFNPQNPGTFWTRQADCEQANPEGCFDLPSDFNSAYYKTTYKAKTDIVACSGEQDCKTKAQTPCPDKTKHRVIGEGHKQTYCTKALRVNEEPAKKAAWERKRVQDERQEIVDLRAKEAAREQCGKAVKGDQNMNDALIKLCLGALL